MKTFYLNIQYAFFFLLNNTLFWHNIKQSQDYLCSWKALFSKWVNLNLLLDRNYLHILSICTSPSHIIPKAVPLFRTWYCMLFFLTQNISQLYVRMIQFHYRNSMYITLWTFDIIVSKFLLYGAYFGIFFITSYQSFPVNCCDHMLMFTSWVLLCFIINIPVVDLMK